ncbi:hypothetical protein IF650_00630 [Cellulosimicrobium terreum]|nr:hypothetical protein [Cellulosimicrobium terreum]
MRRRLSAGGAAAILAGVASLSLLTPPAALGAGDETGTVTGTVFQDLDSDGTYDPPPTGTDATGLPRERGVAGITVTAYDADEDAVGTTVTGADGTYTLDIDGARTTQLRVQYTGLPTGYEPSFSVLEADAGADPVSASNVQLVDIGDTAVTFGVDVPGEYALTGADTPVATAIHYSGAHDEPQIIGQPSIVTFPWLTGPTSAGSAPAFNGADLAESRTVLATVDQTGGVWGMATQPATGDLFSAAVLKRHVDLGPLGLGGIYRVPDVIDPETGALGTPGAVEAWFDLDGQGDVDLNPDGIDLTAAGRNLVAFNSQTEDPDAYDVAGAIGLGSMAISTDQSTLYVMNLTQKRLELIDISGDTPSYLGSQDLGLGADDRPWAVSVQRGRVYVGYVENASAGEQPPPADAPVDDDEWFVSESRAVVRAADEADVSALAGAGSEVLGFDLGFQRGLVWGVACGTPGGGDQRQLRFCHWHPWIEPQGDGTFVFGPDLMGISGPATAGIGWAQPTVSSLRVAADGTLVVGMQDRFSLQAGNFDMGPDGTTLLSGYEGYSQGDILAAAPAGDGTFTLESNGSLDGAPGTGVDNLEGPDGGEFFDDLNTFAVPEQRLHHENTTGGLTTLPGADQVLSTAFDTAVEFRTNGFTWFDTSAGAPQRGRVVQDETLTGALTKAGGLSDVATLLAEAPLQIGNVVWFDADQDGVQDADEPPVPGVTVNLLGTDGTVLATTTTDANGQYYFSTVDVEGFDPGGGDYEVAFVIPTTGTLFDGDDRFGTVPWSEVAYTTPDADSTGVAPDAVDSDAVVADDPTTGTVAYTAGSPGENDPDLDAGLVADVELSVTKVVDNPDDLWVDPDQEFTIDVEARDFRGDPLGDSPYATVTLADGDTATLPEAPAIFPAGTQVQITEQADPGFEVSYDPEPGDDGWLLLDGGDATNLVTVTNTPVPSSGFQITKELVDDEGIVDPSPTFTGEWSCTYPAGGDVIGSGTWAVTAGETVTVATDMPIGAECTVTEDAPVDVDDGTWEDPVVSGTVVIVAGDDPEVPVVDVTNEVVPDSTGFQIVKNLDDPEAVVPDGTVFTGGWECIAPDGTESSGTWELEAGETSAVLADDAPVDAVCSVTEDVPPDVPGGTWETATIADDVTLGVAANDDPIPLVTVDNVLTPLATGFEITKELTDDLGLVPAGTTYTGTWECVFPSGDTTDGTWSLTAGSTSSVIADDLPVGSVCTVTEDPPADVPAGTWEEPVVSPPVTLPAAGDGSEVVELPAVTVSNEFTPAAAGFSIAKTLDDDGGLVPTDTTYTGTWDCVDPEGTATSGTWTLEAGQTTATIADDLPIGTECTVTEDAPTDVDGGSWNEPVISGTVTLTGEGDADGVLQVVGVTNEIVPDEPPDTPTPPVTPTPTPPTPDLPATGAQVGGIAALSLLLLGLGAVALLLARRRRDA